MSIIVFGTTRLLPPPRPRPPRRAAFVAPLAAALLVALAAFGCARGAWGAEPAQDEAQGQGNAERPQDTTQALDRPLAVNVAPLPTATPAPAYTATAEPVRVAPSSRGGARDAVERWREVVGQYAWRTDTALEIVRCESRGDPGAVNPSGATGLFQIMQQTWQRLANTIHGGWVSLLDGEVNTRTAFALYEAFDGWSPWWSSRGCWGGGW